MESGTLANKPAPQTLTSEVTVASLPLCRIDARPLRCCEKHVPRHFPIAQTLEQPQAPHSRTFHAGMGDGVEVDDTGEELPLLVGR